MTMPERGTHADAELRSGASTEEVFEAISATVGKGWRVELIEGDIHVVPPANGEHEEFVSETVDQIVSGRADRSVRVYTGLGLIFRTDETSGDRLIPDLVVAPKGSFADDLEYHDPDPVLMVGEVTSKSTRDADLKKKLRSYARAEIPVYLLIDRTENTVTVYSEPSRGTYEQRRTVPVGKVLPLPEPLGFDLDTGEF
jgi:Uma2 family endonuclease